MSDQELTPEQTMEDVYKTLNDAVMGKVIDENSEEKPPQDEIEQDNVDEAQGEEIEESTNQESEIQEPEYTEDERIAREKGWRPKEEFTGDEKHWVSAREFNNRTELFDKLSDRNKTIKSLNKKIDALIKHNQGLEEATRKKTLSELDEKRREAVQYGDTDAFDAAEKQIKEVESQESTLKVESEDSESGGQQESVEIPQTIKDFAERNVSWFEKNKEMTDFAVFKVQQLVNSGTDMDQALIEAEKEVKKIYANKFRNPKKDKPSDVTPGTKIKIKPKLTMSSITSEQRSVWHTLKNSMTEEQFLEQLEKVS